MNFKKTTTIFWILFLLFSGMSHAVKAQCNAKFTASTINNAKTGDEVKVNFTVENFIELSALQWTLKWDQTVLEYKSIQDLDLTDLTLASFNTTKALSNGYITTSWFNQSGVTKTTGSTIFSITFKVIGADGKTSGVEFSNTPLKQEFADKNSQVCNNITLTNGRVNVGTVVNPPPTGASMTVGSLNGVTNGQDICVPVSVTGFAKITAMQFSMTWDTTKLRFSTVQNFMGLTSFDRNSFGTPGGRLTCVWFDPNTTGQTVADNKVLFEVCFKYQGACPSTATIEVSDTPTKLDVITTTGKLSVTKTAGTVSCSGGATALAASVNKATHPCPSQSNGSITLNVSGGISPYTYTWTNGATSKDISNLPAGNYNVTVKDAANNSVTLASQVSLTAMSASTTQVNPTSGNNGSINLTVTGGNTPYKFLWSNNATTEDINNLAAGEYTYTVTDANNCTLTGKVTLTNPNGGPLDAVVNASVNPACAGQNNGSISVTASGGTPPYTYAWTGPNNFTSTNEDISNLVAGTYKLTVKDAANGTKTSTDIVLTAPAAISVSGTKKDVTSSSASDGAITLNTVSGGTAPYTYRWSDGVTSKDRTSISSGNYAVTVTDSKGCTNGASFNIIVSGNTCFTSSRVFTPNNDGLNDLFSLSCAGNFSNQLFIYNRYNQLVFNVDNFAGTWNGIGNSGLIVPDGSYYWVIKVNNNGVNEVYKGFTTVIRTLN